MTRTELDAFVAHHKLTPQAIDAALEIAGARPAPDQIRRFAARVLQIAGVLSLAAGVVFFVAANWQDFRVVGRFALIEALLAASAAVALWRPPPAALGRYAVLMAFIVTGALLALFGQTYQTGADVYELFILWALLGLPLVVAGMWSVSWAAWVLVLNVALALFCGVRPESGWFWMAVAAWHVSAPQAMVAAAVVNLVIWFVAQRDILEGTRWAMVAPRWLTRFVLACAIGFLTWAGSFAVLSGDEALALSGALALLTGVAAYAVLKRSDVFPLAAIAGSVIVIGTCALGEHSGARGSALFFVLSLWLIASSTFTGWFLMGLLKSWTVEEGTP